jgi:hypothetical protein
MQLDLERVRQNARSASTEELLDRITVYRSGMEPAAIEIIESELDRRGVTPEQIEEFEERRRQDGLVGHGVPRSCSFCDRPAVARAWGLSRGGHSLIKVIPWIFNYCEEHLKSRWQMFPGK